MKTLFKWIGTLGLAGVLSAGLSAMPIQANDVSQRLARELREFHLPGEPFHLPDEPTPPPHPKAASLGRPE